MASFLISLSWRLFLIVFCIWGNVLAKAGMIKDKKL